MIKATFHPLDGPDTVEFIAPEATIASHLGRYWLRNTAGIFVETPLFGTLDAAVKPYFAAVPVDIPVATSEDLVAIIRRARPVAVEIEEPAEQL